MLEGITSTQFYEWVEYAQNEPWFETRADLRMAMLCALIANVNRDPDKQRQPYTVDQFMLHFGASGIKESRQSVDHMVAMAHMMAEAGLGVITYG